MPIRPITGGLTPTSSRPTDVRLGLRADRELGGVADRELGGVADRELGGVADRELGGVADEGDEDALDDEFAGGDEVWVGRVFRAEVGFSAV